MRLFFLLIVKIIKFGLAFLKILHGKTLKILSFLLFCIRLLETSYHIDYKKFFKSIQRFENPRGAPDTVKKINTYPLTLSFLMCLTHLYIPITLPPF